MVVKAATVIRQLSLRSNRSWLRGAVLSTILSVLPSASDAGPLTATASPKLGNGVVAPPSQTQVYDPAAAQFSSLWSYGAMSIIAPIIFGDFVSPTALTSSFGLSSGPMAESTGFDPAVSAVLNATLQLPLQPAGGPAEAEEFDLNSGGAVAASAANLSGWSVAAVGLTGAIPTMPSAAPTVGAIQATITAGGIPPRCGEDEVEKQLQAGGEYWRGQAVSAMPIQFPHGVFAGIADIQDPLGDLGPRGNPTNIPAPGPPGGWCLPPRGGFSESSPIEDRVFWIGLGVLIGGFLVFWLSRGMSMPARSFE